MIPVVALVGRTNVGKSTLFNQLTHTRDAIVGNLPGLTRDRRYGYAMVEGQKFICIDTGGLDIKKNGIEIHIMKQSLLAVKEADIILFIVDAHTGLIPADFTFAKHLRAYAKPIFLVVNKIDGININEVIIDFWSLGLGDVYPIAASYGNGVTRFLKTALLPLLINKVNILKEIDKKDNVENHFSLQDLPIKLAIIGRPNVGKSTLINRILGKERVVVYDIPGTTRDTIYIPMQRAEHKYVLIDTAGVRKRGKTINCIEKFSVIKTLQATEDAHVVLLVIDGQAGIADQDLSLLNFVLSSGRSLVIVVNKWDNISNEERIAIKKNIYYRLHFINFARVHFISALHGNGVRNIFKSVSEAYANSTRHRSSTVLTRIMNMATKNHQPPWVGNSRVRLKYAHVGGYNPLVIVIHGNQVKDLPESYKRYLIKFFYKTLNVVGAPIRIQFKEGKNPFI